MERCNCLFYIWDMVDYSYAFYIVHYGLWNSPVLWYKACQMAYGFKCRGRSGLEVCKCRYRSLTFQLQWCNSRNKSGVLAAICRFMRLAGPGFHFAGTLWNLQVQVLASQLSTTHSPSQWPQACQVLKIERHTRRDIVIFWFAMLPILFFSW